VQNERRKKILKIAFATLVGLYIMIGTALTLFQEKLLFLPTTLTDDYVYQFASPFEELFFETEADAVINAIHFKAKNPKGVILYFHGNAGDLSRWGYIAEYFVEKNYDVLIPDYRTYGKSKGKLSEDAFYTDAQYCYDYLLKHYSEDDITLYGRSLGTGIASYLASKQQPKQLILETPYYSILDVAKHRFPIFPVSQLLTYNFPNYQHLQTVNCDITLIHGTEDAIVPYVSGKKLSASVPHHNITLVTVVGGGHNNLIEFEAYHTAIDSLLK